MKIAFVGKGGSGKTTLASLFAQYSASFEPTTIIDADINVHIPHMLNMDHSKVPPTISSDAASLDIKTKLIGTNPRIKNAKDMKKTTPPGNGSKLIDFLKPEDSILSSYVSKSESGAYVIAVGTYEKSEIGVSCYHNNLSILENILSHSITNNSTLIVDMVAGTDAFASTLHAQFDCIVLVVEPTRKSADIFLKFMDLARTAQVDDRVRYVVNKVEDEDDVKFVTDMLGTSAYLGFLTRSRHIRNVDKGSAPLDYTKLDAKDQDLLMTIREHGLKTIYPAQKRLKMLWSLHKRYVGQGYVIARHGDLSGQIDEEYRFE